MLVEPRPEGGGSPFFSQLGVCVCPATRFSAALCMCTNDAQDGAKGPPFHPEGRLQYPRNLEVMRLLLL